MGAAFHFLDGQDTGFRDLYVGPSFGSHQQGLLLFPQKHTAKAHLGWAKGQLHDHYLSDPRLKWVLHVPPRDAVCQRAGSMGNGQSKRYCQKLQSSIRS